MAGTPFKMKGFSGFGNSPVKQTGSIDFWNQPSRQSDIIHKAEKGIGKTADALGKEVKKVKGKTVKIKTSDIVKQMKKIGSKLKLSDVKKALTTSIKQAGKRTTFIPSLFLGATTTATADQPTKKQGGGQMDPDWLE